MKSPLVTKNLNSLEVLKKLPNDFVSTGLEWEVHRPNPPDPYPCHLNVKTF